MGKEWVGSRWAQWLHRPRISSDIGEQTIGTTKKRSKYSSLNGLGWRESRSFPFAERAEANSWEEWAPSHTPPPMDSPFLHSDRPNNNFGEKQRDGYVPSRNTSVEELPLIRFDSLNIRGRVSPRFRSHWTGMHGILFRIGNVFVVHSSANGSVRLQRLSFDQFLRSRSMIGDRSKTSQTFVVQIRFQWI